MQFWKIAEKDFYPLCAFASLFAAAALACSAVPDPYADESDSTGDLGAAQQPLGMFGDMYRRWPTGTVAYCYQPSAASTGYPQPSTTAYDTTVQLMEDAIAKYEAIPDAAIQFVGGGLCANWNTRAIGNSPATLRIVITDDDAATRSCPSTSIANGESIDDLCGWNPAAGEEIVVVFGRNFWAPEAGILHELGHALGFEHEYNRRASTMCDDDPSLGGGSVGASAITEYDVYSVMNATYCHTHSYLSSKDLAGFSYVYPGATADRLTVPFVFPTPAGLLTGGDDSAVVEFAQRVAGVWGYHYANANWYKSTVSGWSMVATGSAVTLASAIGTNPSTGTVRASFVDDFSRARTSPALTIIRNRGLAAGYVLSTM